jgi:hypothetical protein
MTYDDWKLESPEEENYRIGELGRKRRDRAEWEEEHADELRERSDELHRSLQQNANDAAEFNRQNWE